MKPLPHVLTRRDVCALQLALPFILDERVVCWLQTTRRLGQGMALPPGRSADNALFVVELFEPGRLLDEATLHVPGAQLTHLGLLPIGGCGRGGRELFLVRARQGAADCGQLFRWDPRDGAVVPLEVVLEEADRRALSLSDTRLRRRLPGTVLRANRRPAAVPTLPRRRRGPTAAERTLPLFPRMNTGSGA